MVVLSQVVFDDIGWLPNYLKMVLMNASGSSEEVLYVIDEDQTVSVPPKRKGRAKKKKGEIRNSRISK